jgi:hypothetical protein
MKTSTSVTVLVIAIVAIAGIVYFSRSATPRVVDEQNLSIPAAVTIAFRDELTKRAIENMNGNMPIEGFDVSLLLGAYPGGLLPEDFDGVASFNGIYRYTNGTIEYKATGNQFTSAEQTISDEGYETLLARVSKRLAFEIKNETDAMRLVNQLDTK